MTHPIEGPRPKIKQFSYRRRISFAGLNFAGNPTPVRGVGILQLPRHSDVELIELQIWFGLGEEDPSDHFLEFFLLATDPANIPAVSALRELSAWRGMKVFRELTAVGVNSVLAQDELEFRKTPKYSNRGIRSQNIELLIAARTILTPVLVATGTIEVEITIDRRIWPGNDVPASDLSMEEWHSDDA